jgi:hypothetical protein
MPQFDFFSFFVQIFWLSLFTNILYLVYLKLPLNNSSRVLKLRNKLKLFAIDSKIQSKKTFLYNSFFSAI